MNKQVGIVGYGYLGQAYERVFPEAVIYDEPKELLKINGQQEHFGIKAGRAAINACDIAIVAVPTDPTENGELDTSIVEGVVDWLDTDLILIKSALYPGTTDRLVEQTGKRIANSTELVGMGNYYIDPSEFPDPKNPQAHKTLIIGGELDTASECAEVLWDKMQPNIRINLVSALEGEITKLVENSYPALKVTFINALYELAQKSGGNFIRIHQAWTSDSRVDGFHQRVVSFKRGWASHCWDKDIPALATYARQVGADTMSKLFETVIELNEVHKSENSS